MKTTLLLLVFCIVAYTQTRSKLFGAENEGFGNIMSIASNEYCSLANPAGLCLADSGTHLSASTYQYPLITAFSKYAFAGCTSYKNAVLGLLIHKFGNKVYNEHLANIAFAHKINSISLGLAINYHQLYAEGYSSKKNISVNIGGNIKLHPHLVIGTYLTNLNQTKASQSVNDIFETLMCIGLRFQALKTISLHAEIEKAINRPTNLKVGMKYNINKIFILSTGLNTLTQKLFFGTGINSRKISFWCSYSYNYYLLSGIQLTLKYRFR